MDFGLTDKKAFVGGGSRGIGKAIALELAREGADVVIASRTMSELEKSAQEIAEETGRLVIPMAMDATQRGQVDRVMADAAERLGGLHILVNSASLPGGSASAVGPIETIDDERPARRLRCEVRRGAALRPGRHPVSEGAGLGPYRQHQRRQRDALPAT